MLNQETTNFFGNMHGAANSKEEWLTPPRIIHSLGCFDLDPCAPVVRPWDMAAHHFTIEDDGLIQKWFGRVWMNPPYGNKTEQWMKKLVAHGNGIALIYARTETDIFFPHVWDHADAIFFFKRRLRFYDVLGNPATTKDGKRSDTGAPSCLIAYGAHNAQSVMESGLVGRFVSLK